MVEGDREGLRRDGGVGGRGEVDREWERRGEGRYGNEVI